MTSRPDILWIVTTQWRGQAWGGAGDPNARTPNLDRLARAGTHYRQATTPHPFGPFARAALLTGLPSPRNGVRDYYDPLPTDARTIAHDLRERGYATAWFGKWHLAERDRDEPLVSPVHAKLFVPPDRRGGFDFWEGFDSGFQLNDPWLHGTRLPEPIQLPGYQSDVLCDRAAGWLHGFQSPWFAVVSLEAPHPPYAAPASGIAPRTVHLPANVPPEAAERARRELAGYYAHIEATDRAIGRLVDELPQETVVVVTSVHGDMHGAHGLFRKGWPHEESVRVPLVVRGAGPGGVDDAPVSLLDLPEMTRAWADGVAWTCHRGYAPISMPSVVQLPDQCDRVWSGRRTPRRMEVFNADGSPWLSFDLTADPTEMHNLPM